MIVRDWMSMCIPSNLLAVLVLFQREDVLVEVLLKFLVGKVNVELLESIHIKILEPKDVENTNEGKRLLAWRLRG